MDTSEKYSRFALVREMLETPELIGRIDKAKIAAAAEAIGAQWSAGKVRKEAPFLLTGEGSSRIFPARRAIASALRRGDSIVPVTEGASQALEYNLEGATVCIASNSGKTKEGVRLLRKLKQESCYTLGIVANSGTPIEREADFGLVLSCGEEKAVAATKSVMEQALVYDLLFARLSGSEEPDMEAIASALKEVLESAIAPEITAAVIHGKRLFWAGRNDGVAEELTLKTNEIARKASDFLEGTYAVHGIEEIMNPDDTVILVDPFEEEEEKFRSVLVDGVGLNVVAISDRQTSFPTFRIPESGGREYLLLAAGWNLLVEAGIGLGIDLDHPVRARKVGNEMEQG
jgi:glutamine---fructose-6-phosphate transaminase (isomerizing)